MIKLTQIEELEIALSMERSERRIIEANHRSAMRDRDISIEGLENDVRVHLGAIAKLYEELDDVKHELKAVYADLDDVRNERDAALDERDAAYEELAEVK